MFVDIFNTDKKYNIIYADPPWRFGSKAYQDGNRDMLKLETTQYDTMTIPELKQLPVKNLLASDAVCFMWVTDAHLKEGIDLLESWGFKYKTVAFNWLKTYSSGEYCVNYAPWTLKSWELCLLGTKGSMGKHKLKNNVKGLCIAERTEHSKKPDVVREKIRELFGDTPKIELFARQHCQGWDCWGNEV